MSRAGVAGAAGGGRGRARGDGSARRGACTGRVIVTGQVMVDLALRVLALPEAGGDVFAQDAGTHVGGGFNLMAAAARQGARVEYAGSLGEGAFSDLARDALAREGIVHTGPVVEGDLGYCVALTDADAERTFISTRGAEARDPLDAFDGLELTGDDVVCVSGYSLAHDANTAALARLVESIRRARPGERPTVLFDVAPVVDAVSLERLEMVGAVDPIWSVNEREAGILARRLGLGDATVGFGDAMASARAEELCTVLAPRLGTVIVRAGRLGCWWCAGASEARRAPTIAVDPVDSNGAGDAHTGVLAALLAQGKELGGALRRANAAGAVTVTRIGPATCPTSAELDEVLAAWR